MRIRMQRRICLIVLLLTAALARADQPLAADLAKALGDEAPLVRKRAAIALGRMGAEAAPAVAALRKALLDADPEVRAAASTALRLVGGPLSKEELLYRLKDVNRSARERVAACHELTERFPFDPGVARTLEGLLGDAVLKIDAAQALEAIDRRPRLDRIGRAVTLKGHAGPVTAVAFSPDGKTLASADAEADGSGEIRLWDVAAGRLRTTLRGPGRPVFALAYSPDGKTLAAGEGPSSEEKDAGEVRLWDVDAGVERFRIRCGRTRTTALAFSPDGKTLAVASDDHSVFLWDCDAKAERARFKGHSAAVAAVVFSPDGKTVASAGQDHAVRLWDSSAAELAVQRDFEGSVLCLAFSPDGRTIAAGGGSFDVRSGRWLSGEARLLEAATLKERSAIGRHTNAVAGLAFAPDGQSLVTGGGDTLVKLSDVGGGQERSSLVGHSGRVTAVAFSPDGKWLATGSEDRTVKLWPVVWAKGAP
jgi:dipeptidyl aminopeptidase/acylaminoacyl peptidase